MGIDNEMESLRGGLKETSDFLHRSVADALRTRVATGELEGGTKLPPLRAIADEFDVSTMTVRQAIRMLEREGHVYRIAGVGAFVRPTPPRPRTGQKLIAFVGADLMSSFQGAVARGGQRSCQREGWGIQILDAHFDTEIEARNIESLPESGARGAIILPPLSDVKAVESLFEIHSAEFPLVTVDQTIPGLRADLVASDHEIGAYLATQHLLRHGHTRVFMLTHSAEGSSSVTARVHGYQRALRSGGLEPDEQWMAYIDLEQHLAGFREGRKWFGACEALMPRLRGVRPPLAVLAIDAYAGWGVYEACRRMGLRIPEDVSVVAFDDSEVAHALRPPMTIISQRTEEIGRTAVELLMQRINGRRDEEGACKKFTQVIVDVDLMERESVARVSRTNGQRFRRSS